MGWKSRRGPLCCLALTVCVSPSLGTIRYVDDSAPPGGNGLSWATASNNLFFTLLAAAAGDEIRVGVGTYKPSPASSQSTAYFSLHDGMVLRGGYAGYGAPNPDDQNPAYTTTLSGDLNGNDGPGFANRTDNAYHVVRIAPNTPPGTAACVIDSFTIVGGNAFATFDNHGGGIYAIGPSRITRCILRDNFGYYGGGALYADKTCDASDCTFELNKSNNSGGAIQLNFGSQQPHSFRRCVFRGNVAAGGTGGAVDLYYAYPVFINCTFVANQATGSGGAIKGSYYTLSCINCAFFGNTSGGLGGAIWVEMNGILTGCVFSGNSATGAAGAANGIAETNNCTVAYNHSSNYAGGIQGAFNPIVRNSIFWGNTDPQGGQTAQYAFGGTSQISYTSLQNWTGAWGGTGNNGLNPRFVLPAGFDGITGTDDDDLRLQPADLAAGSPSIDSGDNTAVPADAGDVDEDNNTTEQLPLDIDGNPRISNDPSVLPDADVVNRGAYENPHPAPQVTAWRSNRLHGPAGSLAIALDPAASGTGLGGPTSESRNGGIREVQVDYSTTVQLKQPLSVSVIVYPTANGTVGPPINVSSSAVLSMVDVNTLRILFPSGLPNPACVVIDVSNTIVDMSNNPISGDNDCTIRNMPGDVTSSGDVTLSDAVLALVRMNAGIPVTASPRTDFNFNGLLDASDIQLIKSRIAQSALCP